MTRFSLHGHTLLQTFVQIKILLFFLIPSIIFFFKFHAEINYGINCRK